MKLLALLIASFVTSAQAATYPVRLGENVNLRSGDMAVVQYGNMASVISCGSGTGGGQEDFTENRAVNLSDDFQNRPESNARSLCELGVDPAVSQTSYTLRDIATNHCLRSYRKCEQLGRTTFEYISPRQNRGRHGCFVQVIVRGTR